MPGTSIGRFDGRVAIVTGGSAGIGAAIVQRFAGEGATVVVVDRQEPKGLGQRAVFRPVDVSSSEEVTAMIDGVVAEFGRLDVLCNNAGVFFAGAATATADSDWRRIMSVDLDGVFYGCRAAIPHMQRQGGGAIVNIASVAGIAGYSRMAAYGAAKAGVINLTRAIAIDHAAEGIRANTICPGVVETEMTTMMRATDEIRAKAMVGIPMARASQPAEIAAVAAFLASDDASYMTGCVVPVDGGITAMVRPRDI